ncbi:MAG: DUF932 domain-containing protein [Armatimonadota bacterium]
MRRRRGIRVTLEEDEQRGGNGRRWLGEEVLTYSGTIAELSAEIPTFTRQPFTVSAEQGPTQPNLFGDPSPLLQGPNRYYDVIVREPLRLGEAPIPVGIVSKQYALVQHRDLLNAAGRALKRIGADLEGVCADLEITEYGGRMLVHLRLPEKYDFNPGDGEQMTLRLACINSVDRSMPLQAWLGWFRLICSNGMIVGAVLTHYRQVHDASLDLSDVPTVLEAGLKLAEEDRESFAAWYTRRVEEPRLVRWVDGTLQKAWGVKAAARVHLIAQTGYDGELADPFEAKCPAHQKTMERTVKVPGSPAPAKNAFEVSQALAWVASARRDVQERVTWMRGIPELMGQLLKN